MNQSTQPPGSKRTREEYLRDEPIIGVLLSPFSWLSDQLKQLTDPRDGSEAVPRKKLAIGQKFMYSLAFGCVLFGTNTAYTTMVRATGGDVSEVAFFPHPGIDDYKIQRIVPPVAWMAQEALYHPVNWTSRLLSPVPFNLPKPIPYRATVWGDGRFYMAFIGVLAVQFIEAMAIRKISIESKRRKFAQANAQKKVVADPDSLVVAKVAAAEVNSHGSGAYALQAFMIFLVYLFEIGVFGSSLRGTDTGFIATLALGFFEVFGAETFWGIADRD